MEKRVVEQCGEERRRKAGGMRERETERRRRGEGQQGVVRRGGDAEGVQGQ